MAENPSYLDRLYNEIGQLGERVRSNLTNPSMILRNAAIPYQSMEEQARLQAQQIKGDYMEMQDSEQPQPEQPRPSIPGLEDPYLQYLEQNKAALTGPYLPQNQYAAPTREEYQKYFVEGQAPVKAIAVTPAVSEMVTTAPKQAPAAKQAQQPVAQPQRPMTIREQIEMMPFKGDRHEAMRKVMEAAKRAKINEAYAYADAVYNGVGTVEGGRFIEHTLKQIDANFIVPKPIEETEDFNTARTALVSGKHADRTYMLAEMKEFLEAAKEIKDKDKQVIFLELNLPKLAQSIAAGPDAIQKEEARRIMPELDSVWQNPANAIELIAKKGFGKAFSKQPKEFIEKLAMVYDASIPIINQQSYYFQDNLGSAFKGLGIGYLTPIGAKNQGLDMTKLQQLREGVKAQRSVFSQTNPAADRPASTGPQIVPGMRFGTAVPSSMSYGSTPSQVQGSKPMPLGY
jgi:hypothetical protein